MGRQDRSRSCSSSTQVGCFQWFLHSDWITSHILFLMRPGLLIDLSLIFNTSCTSGQELPPKTEPFLTAETFVQHWDQPANRQVCHPGREYRPTGGVGPSGVQDTVQRCHRHAG